MSEDTNQVPPIVVPKYEVENIEIVPRENPEPDIVVTPQETPSEENQSPRTNSTLVVIGIGAFMAAVFFLTRKKGREIPQNTTAEPASTENPRNRPKFSAVV